MQVVCWSLAWLFSMIGWGDLVERTFMRRQPPVDWGLRAAWGVALTLAMGGFALLALKGHPHTPWQIWIGMGLLIFLIELGRKMLAALSWARASSVKSSIENRPIYLYGLQILYWISLGIVFMQGLNNRQFSCFDDALAYLTHAKMVFEISDLSDPFSFRRLASYGGQAFLHGMYLFKASEQYLPAMEKSIVMVALATMIRSFYPRGARLEWATLGLATVTLYFKHPWINLAPVLSGLLLVFCLIRTLRIIMGDSPPTPWKGAILLAIVSTGLLTLRANYVLGLVLFLAVSFSLTDHKNQRAHRVMIARTAILTLLCTAPWAWLLMKSSGTPFFPLFDGNFNAQYGTFHSGETLKDYLRFIKDCLLATNGFSLIVLLGVARVFLRKTAFFGILIGALVAAICTEAVTAVLVIHTQDIPAVSRYAHPFIYSALIYVILEVVSNWDGISKALKGNVQVRHFKQLSLVLVILMSLSSVFLNAPELPWFQMRSLIAPFTSESQDDFFASERRSYQALQAVIPLGKVVVTALDTPFLLDYARNQILNLDVPGNASPPPGLPIDGTEKEMDLYLKGVGADYLAFTDPDHSNCEYARNYWKEFTLPTALPDSHREWAVHHLHFFSYLDAKRAGPNVVFTDGRIYLIRF